MEPALGSMSRISVRTSVDLPDPRQPMTTNTSARVDIERDISDGDHIAGRLAQLGSGELGVGRADHPVAVRSETFQTLSARTTGSLVGLTRRFLFSGHNGTTVVIIPHPRAMIYQHSRRRRLRCR